MTTYVCIGSSREAALVAAVLDASGASTSTLIGGPTLDLDGLTEDTHVVFTRVDNEEVPASLTDIARPITLASHADLLRTPLATTAALLTRLQDPGLRLPPSTKLNELIASEARTQPTTSDLPPTASAPKRAAIVVLGCRLEPFAPILAAVRSTWGATHNDNIDIYYAYGNSCDDHVLADAGIPDDWVPENETRQHHDLLLVGAADVIHHQSDAILRKRLLSLQHLLAENDHDAFLLLCASSYIDQDEFSHFLQNVDLTMAFHGIPNATDEDEPFLSGSCMFLSRDLAMELVDNADAIIAAGGYQYADDVTFARWIADNISNQRPAEIINRLFASGEPGTDNTFQAFPASFQDFTKPPTEQHREVDGCFHYHFATARPDDMRLFHNRIAASAGSTAIQTQPQRLQFTIDLDTSAIERRSDYEIWVFALLDASNNELWRNDITDPEVLSFASTQVEVDGIFSTTPTSYLLWPRTSEGFSDRVVNPLTDSPITVD